MAKKRSNTTPNNGEKMPGGITGKGFKPGPDPRRNTKGRPKSFDELRSLFQGIASEEITIHGKKYTRAQAIGIAMSMDKKMMRDFLEFAFGKVPQPVAVEGDPDKPIKIVVEYANDTDGNKTQTS